MELYIVSVTLAVIVPVSGDVCWDVCRISSYPLLFLKLPHLTPLCLFPPSACSHRRLNFRTYVTGVIADSTGRGGLLMSSPLRRTSPAAWVLFAHMAGSHVRLPELRAADAVFLCSRDVRLPVTLMRQSPVAEILQAE